MSDLAIDHVIVGVQDLDAAGDMMRARFGLDSVFGGRHPVYGTGNRIVPVGNAYIELMGIVDPATAEANPIGQALASAIAGGDRTLGWVVQTGDIDSVAARLALDVVPGERVTPDGTTVRWRSAGMHVLLTDPHLPFFITWDDPALHPSTAAVRHTGGLDRIAWVEVGGDLDPVHAWLGTSTLPVRTGSGEGVLAFGLAGPDGEREFRL